jgi:hypothetical protein
MVFLMRSSLSARMRLIGAVLVSLLLTCFVFAQTTISTGSIQGTVTDPSGSVIAGTKITITSKETGQATHLTSTSAGTYSSRALIPGNYTVRVESGGFKTTELYLVVEVGVTAAGNIKLQIGEAKQVVQVHDTEVVVNTEQAAIQGTLTTQQIENLPINGRNFIDLAQLEPGVQTQDVSKSSGKIGHAGISVGGRYSEATRVEVDGLDMSDDTGSSLANISTSSIQEFSIAQSSMDLSSESTNSGSVNIVTRTGTNTMHGEGLYLFRDRSLAANFLGGLHPPYQRHDFAGNLGGTIVKNKLFFFANGERYKQDLGAPYVVLPPLSIGSAIVNQPLRQSMLQGRVDDNAPKGVRFFYRFAYDNSKIVGSPPITEREVDNTPTHAMGADFNTGRFTHSIRFGYLKNVELFQNAPQSGLYNPLPQVSLSINTFVSGVNTAVPAATYRDQKQIRYDGARSFASHIVRYGFSYTRIMSAGFAQSLGAGPQLFTSVNADTENYANNSCGPNTPCFPGGENNPLNYPLGSGGLFFIGNGRGFGTEIPGFGLPAGANPADNRIQWYVGDNWKIKPNLTLNYGLHYIHDTGITNGDLAPLPCSAINPNAFPNPNVLPPCAGNLLDVFGPGLSARPHDPSKNFALQGGIAWDIFKNGKTVLRAGAAQVYSPSASGLSNRLILLPKGFFSATITGCPTGNLLFPAPGGQQVITRTPPTAAHPNGLDIATQVCNPNLQLTGFPVGRIADDIVALQHEYQADSAAAGLQANPSFIGQTLSTNTGLSTPDYHTPYSYQMNVGMQHEIHSGIVISADYVRNVSLRFPLVIDANHVGDSRYLNKTAANNAINGTNAAFGCPAGVAGIDCSIAAGATIEDYAANGLTSTINFSGVAPSLIGLTPDHAAAFAGINPNVGQALFNYPIGRANYNALQVTLRQQTQRPLPYTKSIYLQFSYNLSRYASPLAFSVNDDQDSGTLGGGNSGGAAGAKDYRNPFSHFGPTAFDRTHQFSLGTTMDFLKPLRVAVIGHVYSPLSQSMVIRDRGRSGEIFHTDFTGDGTTGDLLPGTRVGAFGRDVKSSNMTSVLQNYNNTIAGTILPAGQALISAGLFTQQQLTSLGAVADKVPLGTTSDRVDMKWLKTADLKVSSPIKLGERFVLEPSAAAYNLFNFANFMIDPRSRPSSNLRGTPGTVNGTSNTAANLNAFRAIQGPSMFSLATARQFEFGMKIAF